MASGFVTATNLDLDSVLAPQHSGWPQASATEFFDGSGNDLNLRYATLATGSAAAATEFVDSAGNDLNTVFAGFGTTNVQVLTQPGNVSGSAAAGSPSGTVTSGTTSCAGTKGKGSGYTFTWHIAYNAGSSGVAFTAGTSATTGVTGSIPAGKTYSGTMYCTISDGVSSANTGTRTWSLTNTTTPEGVFHITAGQSVVGSNSFTGYIQGDIGSGTDLTLPDGKTVYQLNDFTQTDGIDGAYFSVSGFSADPGSNYFSSIVANGVTHVPSNATYTYGSGIATWEWAATGSTLQMFGFSNGANYTADLYY